MNNTSAITGAAFFPKAGRIACEQTKDLRIEIDGRGIFLLKAEDRARLIWNEQVRVYSRDNEFYVHAGFARLSRSGKAVMFSLGHSIYMTPLSLIRKLVIGSTDKCILSLLVDGEPVKSDIRAGLATGFD